MSKYLKNTKNGHIYNWTPILAPMKCMIPCDKDGNTADALFKKAEIQERLAGRPQSLADVKEAAIVDAPDYIPPEIPEQEKEVSGKNPGLPSEDEGSALVHRLFGKPVGNVKKSEMLEYAGTVGLNLDDKMTKLEIMTEISKVVPKE